MKILKKNHSEETSSKSSKSRATSVFYAVIEIINPDIHTYIKSVDML